MLTPERLAKLEAFAFVVTDYAHTADTPGRPLYANECEAMEQFLFLRKWLRRWNARWEAGTVESRSSFGEEFAAALRGEKPPE